MTQTAKLHDGRVLSFPDSHTPDQIKSHVKAVLKKESESANKGDKQHGEKVRAIQDAGKSMAVGVGELGKKIDKSSMAITMLGAKMKGVDEISAAVKELADNIGSLEDCIKDCTAMIIKVLKAPRKITTNTKGKPTGMQIGDD